jgi:hypothetical protein
VKDIPNFNKFFLFFKVCSIYFKELLSFLHHLVYLHSLIYQFVLHCCAPFAPRSGGRSPLRPPGHSPFFCTALLFFAWVRALPIFLLCKKKRSSPGKKMGYAQAERRRGCFAPPRLCLGGAKQPRQKKAVQYAEAKPSAPPKAEG